MAYLMRDLMGDQQRQMMEQVRKKQAKQMQSAYDTAPQGPEFNTLLDQDSGMLKDQYQMEAQLMDPGAIEGYGQLKDFATGTGPSEYAQQAQQQLDLKTALSRDEARADAAGQAAQARSSLAMRGGLSGGARERLGAQGIQAGVQGAQKARQAQLLGGADISMQDAAARQQALGKFVGFGADLGQFNIGQQDKASQFNIEKALQEQQSQRGFELQKYQEEGKKWAAMQKAQAEAAACFAPDTMITFADGSRRPLHSVKLGDELALGGKVYAIYMQAFEDGLMYDYEGVKVTGSHPVYEDGKWVRVENSKKARQIDDEIPYVIDLSTENHRILIGTTVFSDFAENDDFYAGKNESIAKLNRESSTPYAGVLGG